MKPGSKGKGAMLYESGIRHKLLYKLYWKKSPYRIIFDTFLKGKYTLCLSSEIMLEHEEKFMEFWGTEVTTNLMGRLLVGSNTSLYAIYYNFLLIPGDPDDNKFADLYLAANADCMVSNDRLVLALRNKKYPPINVITIQEFANFLSINQQ